MCAPLYAAGKKPQKQAGGGIMGRLKGMFGGKKEEPQPGAGVPGNPRIVGMPVPPPDRAAGPPAGPPPAPVAPAPAGVAFMTFRNDGTPRIVPIIPLGTRPGPISGDAAQA